MKLLLLILVVGNLVIAGTIGWKSQDVAVVFWCGVWGFLPVFWWTREFVRL